jgi:hypothetical protein
VHTVEGKGPAHVGHAVRRPKAQNRFAVTTQQTARVGKRVDHRNKYPIQKKKKKSHRNVLWELWEVRETQTPVTRF